jgi:hypothetical protein
MARLGAAAMECRGGRTAIIVSLLVRKAKTGPVPGNKADESARYARSSTY